MLPPDLSRPLDHEWYRASRVVSAILDHMVNSGAARDHETASELVSERLRGKPSPTTYRYWLRIVNGDQEYVRGDTLDRLLITALGISPLLVEGLGWAPDLETPNAVAPRSAPAETAAVA